MKFNSFYRENKEELAQLSTRKINRDLLPGFFDEVHYGSRKDSVSKIVNSTGGYLEIDLTHIEYIIRFIHSGFFTYFWLLFIWFCGLNFSILLLFVFYFR